MGDRRRLNLARILTFAKPLKLQLSAAAKTEEKDGCRSTAHLRNPSLSQYLLLWPLRRDGGHLPADEVLLRGRHGQLDHAERGLPPARPHRAGVCQALPRA